MSEADVLPEGGAPLPPKRPTIIRPAQDGRGPVPARPAPARPAPPPPGARPPPGVPTPAAAAGAPGPSAAAVPQRPSGPVPAPSAAKQPDHVAKPSSIKGKSQGSVRKRPEITIVDARPMSQAGFREIKASDSSPVPNPAVNSVKDEETVKQPSSNGGLPAAPSRPPPTSSTTPHSTPPPNHSPPPIPSSRPGAPPSFPPSHPEKSAPDQQQAQDPVPPSRPSRPTILRPARPKSAIITGNQSSEGPLSSPPPPLPKRSPIVSETSAPGDLIDFNPPPKPARVSQGSEGSQAEEEKEAEGGEKGEGHTAPKKPTRASIIRPPRRPKSMIDTAPESNDEPKEGGSPHLPRPKPPPPPSRPVAIVSAALKVASETESPHSGDVEQTRPAGRPVPAARPRSSPKDCPQEEPRKSPVASPRTVPQNSVAEQSTKPPQHTDMEKSQGAPDRPKPPVPASRPQGPPPAVPSGGASPRLSQKMVPSKPAPPGAVGGAPTSLPPPLVPSKPPAGAGVVPAAEGCLYAVSEPLETTDSFTSLSPPSGSQLSRPPPPVPKSRPRSIAQSSPMVGRPLPSVPGESSNNIPSPDHAQSYEDIDSVKAQAADLSLQQNSLSPRENAEGVREEQREVDEAKCEDDVSGMYAKVNKPNKQRNPQNSHPGINSSDSPASNPFGVHLKHIAADESPESEPPPVPPKLGSDELEELAAPVVSPKSKPSVSVKPQIAAKPKSPRKEEVALETPEPSTKTDSSEQNKPPLAAKRPTIIRPPKPAPKLESVAPSNDSEETTEVQVREKVSQEIHPAQPELPSNGDNKTSTTGRPPPPRRPVTIIGFPQQRQKAPEGETGSQPGPAQQNSEEPSSEVGKSEVTEVMSEVQTAAPPPPHSTPPVSRPPPPRPGKPCKPEPPDQPPVAKSEPDSGSSAPPKPPSPVPPRPAARPTPHRATNDKEEGGEALPDRPPSPAPPRPATRPSPPTVSAEGGDATVAVTVASSLESSPPISKSEPEPSEEDSVQQRPRPARGPPPRPVSMPPVKPPLSANKVVSPAAAAANAESKHDKPSRPQPARPTLPRPSHPTAAPPPLPCRPGLSHPLYGYMAAEPHAIAVHSYPAQQADELAFQEGDTVVLLKCMDEQWLMGKVGDKEGIFPQNFVDIIHPLHDELPPSAMDDVIDSMFEDALQEKPDLLQGPRCRARFDFDGEGEDDLAFEDGDVIQLIARCGEDWLKGELNRKTGMFPAAFVEVIEDLPEATEQRMGAEGGGERQVTALFDFVGQAGELSFEGGDRITILSRVDEQWLFGRMGGREGSFPAAFVDDVPDDLPLSNPQASSHSSASASGPQASHSPANTGVQDKPEQWCTALHSFEKLQEEDLGFSEGDRILILDRVGDDWLRGRLGDREGMFPAGFVQVDSAGKGGEVQKAPEPEDHGTGLSTHTALVMGRALFDYEAQADDELSFKVNEEIVLGSMVSEGSEWQWGELHGKKGIFPSNFVEMI